MLTIKKALSLFSQDELRRGTLVLGMVMIMALLEVGGIAAVMPFLAVAANPEIINQQPTLAKLYGLLGFESTEQLVMAIGYGAAAAILLSAAFRILTVYAINRFARMRNYTMSARLLSIYLRQPYEFFLNRSSDSLSVKVLNEVEQFVNIVLLPAFYVAAYSAVIIAIIVFLFVVDTKLALIVGIVVIGSYSLIYLLTRSVLARVGAERVDANRQRFKAAGEALAGIKEIKLLGCEEAYLLNYRSAAIKIARGQVKVAVLSETPKYAIEGIAIGGIVLLTLYLLSFSSEFSEIIPKLGLYALAGYKLLPAGQQVYAGISQLRSGGAIIDTLYEDQLRHLRESEQARQRTSAISISQRIVLRDISFRYPGASDFALNKINLAIRVGESVGLVGGSGAGKTTLIDLILGLLQPTMGELFADNERICNANIRAWQASIGYVPQNIFLSDSTVSENIAFGIQKENIDFAAVQRASRLAQLHDFVVEKMPKQYDTPVGERGLKLSGGQRQRIGIARALYHDPAILVLDEATSALDGITEHSVMQAIKKLGAEKTVIIIAHRLATVRDCDKIAILKGGAVVGLGTYDELSKSSAEFQEMLRFHHGH